MNLEKTFSKLKLTFIIPKKNINLSNNERLLITRRNQRVGSVSFTDKNSYMKSKEWQLMQKIWLNDKGYRCQMFPFLVLGQHKPKKGWWDKAFYGKFAIHHVNRKAYENLGSEEIDKDVIVLSKFAHKWIFHFLLSFGKKKAGEQKFLKFANPLQLGMNYWCFLNKWIKLVIVLLIIYILL